MSNFNTLNAVPSDDPRDLDDNATVLDNLVTGAASSYPDRLGRLRKSWQQIENDAAALVSPNVSALASAVSAANKLFYFTGSGTGSVTDFTVEARNFLAAVTKANQRTSLGLGTISTVAAQTSASDATAGSALLVGAGGLLGNALPIAESAIDAIGVTGEYNVTAGGLGKLPVNTNGYLHNGKIASAGFQFQIYSPVTGGRFYWRFQVSSAWGSWGSFANAGANSDITSITGLTTPLSVAQGGTGGNSQAAARTGLGLGTAAVANTGTSGANVPLLNTANTWSATQVIGGSGVTAPAGGLLNVQTDQGTFALASASAINTIYSSNAANAALQPLRFACATAFAPALDNSVSFGDASHRSTALWATTGTIQTSDARYKTVPRSLNDSETKAAIELSRKIGMYKWLESVECKGEDARNHLGLTVQDAIEVLESFNLDPFAYGFICYDEWPEIVTDGQVVQAAGNRYSFRYDQLNLMIAAGISARLEALEANA